LEKIPELIKNIDKNNQIIHEQFQEIRSKIVYNIGNSAKIGAKYIQQLIEADYSNQ